MTARSLLVVVDDDESVRESLPPLLASFDFDVRAFASGEEFLEAPNLHDVACLILDVGMPGLSGPEVQRAIAQRGLNIPIIFISALASESRRIELMERGAFDYLVKPLNEKTIIGSIRAATARSEAHERQSISCKDA